MGNIFCSICHSTFVYLYETLLEDVPWTLTCIASFLDIKNFETLALKIVDTLKIGDDTNEMWAIRIREKYNLRRFRQGVHEE
jgi:hypothetical protein